MAFNTLERWARWFGWVRRARRAQVDVLWPDPTPLVRAVLPEILGSEALPLAHLSSRWPSGCRGCRTDRWDGRLPRLWLDVPDRSVDEGRVPEGLSLTLERLHLEKTLRLVAGDDAKDRMLLSAFGVPQPATRRWLRA